MEARNACYDCAHRRELINSAVKALEPFAEIGRGVAKDSDGVWRRRYRGQTSNLGRTPEIIFEDYAPFVVAAEVSNWLEFQKGTRPKGAG